MPEPIAIIDEVYIAPIKSVLFVDDQFPTYGELLGSQKQLGNVVELPTITDDEDFSDANSQRILSNSQANPQETDQMPAVDTMDGIRAHYDRAKNLTDSCRSRGFIFDVESDYSKLLAGPEDEGFFNKPDLIVLDYYLEHNIESGARALEIIRRLNDSPRFNLVIVHTSLTPINAAQEIAYALRGGGRQFEEQEGFEIRTRGFTTEKLGEFLLDYLNAKQIDEAIWRTKLKAKTVTKEDITACFEKLMSALFPAIQVDSDKLLGCGCGNKERPWIRGGNVFIVVVQKPHPQKESIDMLLDALRGSLEEYQPAPLTMLIQHTVNIFKRHGEVVLDGAFGDAATRAALLLYSLIRNVPTSGDVKEERNIRVADLTQRALATLAHGLHPHIQDVGEKILEGIPVSADPAENSRLALTREKASVDIPKETLALYMNAFLCSQKVTRTHMTTGIVFWDANIQSDAWVCVTPACDLVPGQVTADSGDYRTSLAPLGYFEALRMRPVEPKEAKKATNGRHIFLSYEGKLLVYEFAVGNGNILSPCIFYTQDNGLFDSTKKLKLSVVEKQTSTSSGGTGCGLAEIQAQVIAQLRPEFANRLLTQKGAWSSRIGVDFVNFNGSVG